MFWHNVLCPLSSNNSQKHRYRQRTKAVLGGFFHMGATRLEKEAHVHKLLLILCDWFTMQPANPIKKLSALDWVTRILMTKTFQYSLHIQTSVESSWLIKMPTSNKHQRETIFDVNSVHFFIHFITIFPLYIYAEFCNVHPRVTASSRFLRGLPVVLE